MPVAADVLLAGPRGRRVCLEAAGRVLSVGGAAAMTHGAAASADGGTATVLAGWDPDATYWFVPVRPDPTTAHAWERDDRGVWRS